MNKPSSKTVLTVLKVVLWIIAILMIGLGIAGIWFQIWGQGGEQRSYGLLGAGILLGIILLIWGRLTVTNIEPEDAQLPPWDPKNTDLYLTAIFDYVVNRAKTASNWYWSRKRSKAAFSQVIRFVAWLLAGVAGLLPILGALQVKPGTPAPANAPLLTNGLLASILVGTAAALLGLDKVFGFSSGWTRYVLAGTMIGKSLEQFRLDWASLKAQAGNNPTIEATLPMINRAVQFIAEIQGMVLQETKEWVTEFQSNLSQMEKDIGTQLEQLKIQVDKATQSASQTGAIKLTIQNYGKATAGSVNVTLTDPQSKQIQNQNIDEIWPMINLVPGQYKLTVDAIVGGNKVTRSDVVIVEANKVVAAAVSLS